MRRGAKIVLITLGGLIALLLILAMLVPELFKPQLLRFAQRELSQRVEADVTLGDLHVSLFKAFPRLYLGLDDISVVTRGAFAGDTLVAFGRFGIAVNIKTLFDLSNVEVYSVDLQRLRAYAHRDSLGRANWDVLPATDSAADAITSSDESKATSVGLRLQRLNVRNAVLSYRDDATRLFAEARDLNFTLSGDLHAERSVLEFLLSIAKTTFELGGNVMAPGVALSLHSAVDADLAHGRYALGENELKINDLGLRFSGVVDVLGDSLVTDLRFGTTRTDFKTLLSLVPAMYKRGLADIQTDGELQLEGAIKGTMYGKELPDANLTLKVDKARFQYPTLPKGVENIGIDLSVAFNGKDNDRTQVDLNRFHAEMAGNAVDAKAHVRTPISDPNVQATILGRVDLGAIHEVLPLDSLSLQGLLDLSVRLAASQSQVKQQQYEACELDGHINLTDAVVKGVLPMAVQVPKLQLALTPKQLRIENLEVIAGRTDASISGGVRDFLPYLMTNGTVSGDLKLRSHRVDLNELFPPSQAKSSDEQDVDTASAAVDLSVARRVVFAFDSQIDSLYFQQLKASDVRGRFALQNGLLSLSEIAAKALGGGMFVSGDFDFSREQEYTGSVKVKLHEVSVQESVNTFASVEKLVSAAKYMQGTVSLNLGASAQLGRSFDLNLKSLQARGDLRTSVLSLNGVPAFEKLGSLLKNDYISRPALDRVTIPFEIRDGNVLFSPFDFAIKGVKGKMGGRIGLDQTLDYTINMMLPRGVIGKGAEALTQLEKHLPSEVSIGAEIPVGVRVTGVATSPKIELTVAKDFGNKLRDLANRKVEGLKRQAEEKVEEVKAQVQESIDAAVAKAEVQAAQLREQAKATADKVLVEAQAKADQLVAEAAKRGPLAEFAAKKAADKVMEEARAKASEIIAEADRKADALVAEAKSKAKL